MIAWLFLITSQIDVQCYCSYIKCKNNLWLVFIPHWTEFDSNCSMIIFNIIWLLAKKLISFGSPVLIYATLSTCIWSFMSILTIEIVKYRFLIKFGVQWYVTRLYFGNFNFWRYSEGTKICPFGNVQVWRIYPLPNWVKCTFSWSLYPDASFKMVTGLNEYLTAPPSSTFSWATVSL